MTIDYERLGLLSASDDAGWHCPGKQNLWRELGYPAAKKDESADSGTRIHEAFQTGNTLMLNEEETDVYKQGMKFLESMLLDWLPDRDFNWYEGQREERFWIHDTDTLEPLLSAKLDRHYFKGIEEAFVIDLKSGFGVNLLPSAKSTQLRVQASCLKAEFPILKTIRVAYCLPKDKYSLTDFCVYTEYDLKRAENWIRQHVWLSSQEDAPRVPGRHCNYCPCKAFCKEAGAYSLLPSVIPDTPITASKQAEEAVAQMNDRDLARIWKSASVIRKILEEVSDRLKTFPEDRLAAIGISPAPGRKTPRITKVQEAFTILKAKGWTDEQIFKCMEFSLVELAVTARAEQGFTNDKDSATWVKSNLSEQIIETVSDKMLKAVK